MLTITIPSTRRKKRLRECLESIDYDRAIINVGARDTSDIPWDLVKKLERIQCSFSHDLPVSVQIGLAICSPLDSDILPISDDILFQKGAIRAAISELEHYFPDHDGIIGFDISNMPEKDKSPYAFMLVGSKFFNDRLGRYLFFNGYRHFYADTEIGMFAESLDRFRICYKAQVVHFHPCTGVPADETHLRNRVENWSHDNALFLKRRRNIFEKCTYTIFPHLSNALAS